MVIVVDGAAQRIFAVHQQGVRLVAEAGSPRDAVAVSVAVRAIFFRVGTQVVCNLPLCGLLAVLACTSTEAVSPESDAIRG